MAYIDIIHNLSILTTLVLLFAFVTEKWYSYYQYRSIFFGIIFGFITIVGMMEPFHYSDGIIFDGRTILLGLSGLFGGPIAVIISSAMALAYRVDLGGAGQTVGILVIFASSSIGLVFHYLFILKNKTQNGSIFFVGFIIHVVSLLLMFFMPQEQRMDIVTAMSIPYLFLFPIIFFILAKVFLTIEASIKNRVLHAQSEEQYQFAIEGSASGIWDWNLATQTVYYSPHWKQMLGYRDDELENTYKEWESRIYPDDKQRSLDEISKHMRGESVSYENIHRLKHKDGHWIWVVSRGKIVSYDDAGKPIRMVGTHTDITKRKDIEEALKVSNDKFEKAFNRTPNIIIITNMKTGKIYEVNQRFVDILGYPKEEVLGKTTFDINLWTNFDNREEYLKSLNDIDSVYGTVYSFNCKDGSVIMAQIYASVIEIKNEKYILAVADDITQRQKNLELLKQKKRELETVIQEAPNPIMLHNEDGKVLMINKVWKSLSGYNYEEIDTIEKWTKNAYVKNMSTVKSGINKLYKLKHRVDEGEYEITTKKGKIIIWKFSSAPLGIIDNKRTVISSAMDITELQENQKMLMSQSRNAALGEMIAMIAHQWRQPLAVIAMEINNLQLGIALEEEIAPHKLNTIGNNISLQVQHLSKTIDDFRNFLKPTKEKVLSSACKVMKSAIEILEKSLENYNITLEITTDCKSEILILPNELLQVFLNLINNSRDVLQDSKLSDAHITITINEDEKFITTTICDNGGGIQEEILENLGKPYTSSKGLNGTGLGIYMSKIIIEKHFKGTLSWQNRDKGACFIVILPLNAT